MVVITLIDIIICLVALILWVTYLVSGLLKIPWGRSILANSVPRRNNMPFYMPLIPLFIWILSISLGNWLIDKWINPPAFGEFSQTAVDQLPPNHWQNVFFNNLVLGIGEITTIVVMIFLARASFARRLKGFGLNAKTIHKDFLAAIANLLSVWPLILLMVILTLFFGRLMWGQDFQMQRHEQLETIVAYRQLPLRILVFVVAVAIAPVFEEMLFRGFFQSMLRSFVGMTWVSILISSAFFASVHQRGHWPALFVLAICMGYSYEKSGSLFRPILIHALFNTVIIVSILNA